MELREVENPRKWRFTWEAQSHIPTLRLFLFDSQTKPSLHCRNLQVHVSLSQSLVLLTWFENDKQFSLRVPLPRVLIDDEPPVSFRAMDDHIEVKLVLLLPVGHPIVSSFDSILNLSGDEETQTSNESRTLSVDSGELRVFVHFVIAWLLLKFLCLVNEEIPFGNFYCCFNGKVDFFFLSY